MQFQSNEARIKQVSRQPSVNGSIISRKSTQKQVLKQQINFLKQQVKKLKIDKLNQKIMYEGEKNHSNRTIEQSNIKTNNNRSNRYENEGEIVQEQSKDRSERTQYLLDKKSEKQESRQTIVNFRVGRIVKNNPQTSQQRTSFRQSRTIEIKKKTNSEVFMFTRPQNSRISSDHKNTQIHSDQIFRTIESNHKFSFLEDNQVIASILDIKPAENNFLSKELVRNEKKRSLINFDQTIQSAELQLPITSQANRNENELKLNSNIKNQNRFSKSTTFRQPQNISLASKAQTDNLWFTNPQNNQQQVGDIIRDKNINIRKVSYKLKKPSNTSRDPEKIRKQKLLEEFMKQQAQNHERNERYTVGGRGENNNDESGDNINFENVKENTMGKKNFKARLMSKSKVYAKGIEDELKHKLRGKIIKNFGQHIIEPDQAQPQSQNEFTPQQIPQNKFSISQLPYFAQKPHPKSNQQQIITLTLSIARKLNLSSIKRQLLQGIVIKKFKNCLIFAIPETNKKIIWYYEGRFYFGEGEKQGEEGYKSGQGVEFIPEKSFYKGQFYENRKHGSGVMVTQKGNIYQGQWYQGHQQGNGKFYDAQSDKIYQGEFKNGKFDGFGILKTSLTEIYKGTFMRNIKHGFGIETFKNGDKYKGEFSQGKFHGKGRYKWSNGNIYEGQFVGGLRTGTGKWRSSKQGGDMYIGMYLNDKKHGLGKYCWQDGSVFEGNFEQDEKHGEGILTYKDGKTVHGKWVHNLLVEVMNVESDREEEIEMKIIKKEGWQKIELIDRVENEMIRSKLLRNF